MKGRVIPSEGKSSTLLRLILNVGHAGMDVGINNDES